jgi:crotonobetainyl-CoA:carnitine CoA-transferase CaiB-like acyl-CoA transferase
VSAGTGIEASDRRLPLDDIAVLDLTSARSGPVCVRHLSDWGARVIRIEPPGGARADLGPRSAGDFQNLHRNKRSLTLDLKQEEGREIFFELVGRSDVIVENMRPRVKHRLGIDYESVHADKPSLVYGSISGFGEDGPGANRGGADQIVQGMSGLMSVTGFPEGPPVRTGAAVTDVASGILLAFGIVIALRERDRTGEGGWVQTSLLAAALTLLDFQAARYTFDGVVPERGGNRHPTAAPMGCYRTRDGWLNVAPFGGPLYRAFCRVVGMPELIDDARFRDGPSRLVNRDALSELLSERFAQRSTAEWVREFDAAGVPAGPVYALDEVFADPHTQHLGVAQAMPGTAACVLGSAITIPGHRTEIHSPGPDAGEHTHEILADLGLSPEEISRLAERGVV